MDNQELDRIPVTDLQARYNIKKSKLYADYLSKCQIQTIKISGRSYITSADLQLLDEYHAAVGRGEEEEFLTERVDNQELGYDLTRSTEVRELHPVEEGNLSVEVRGQIQMMQLTDRLSSLSSVNRCIAIKYLLEFLAKERVTLDRPALLSLLNKQTLPPSRDGEFMWMGYRIEKVNKGEWRVRA